MSPYNDTASFSATKPEGGAGQSEPNWRWIMPAIIMILITITGLNIRCGY